MTSVSRISPTSIPLTDTPSTTQVRLLRVQHPGQIAGLTAFAGDEAEILESVGEEGSKVLLAVGDAGPRHHLSMPETARARMLVRVDVVHAPPLSTNTPATVVHPRGGANYGILTMCP